jgi:hypothetical protein|tara:strand:- start:1504 stop:1695 length:192 start_codon:yes stop_codon:yes gene_type:complete
MVAKVAKIMNTQNLILGVQKAEVVIHTRIPPWSAQQDISATSALPSSRFTQLAWTPACWMTLI